MSPLSGRKTEIDLQELIRLARQGSDNAARRLIAECKNILAAMVVQESSAVSEGRRDVGPIVETAAAEAERQLAEFSGSSEDELRRWLREIILERTLTLQAPAAPGGRGDAMTPFHDRITVHEKSLEGDQAAREGNNDVENPQPDLFTFEGATSTEGFAAVGRGGGRPLRELTGFSKIVEIARGGMGIVYKACQDRFPRDVALKILPPAYAHDPEWVERFRLEARLAAKVTGHGILQIYDILEVGETLVLVLPFIDGSDLNRILTHRRALKKGEPTANRHPWAEMDDRRFNAHILPFFDKVLDSLVRLHEAGVLHRDLKPSNLLVDRNGDGWVTDFGLARHSQNGAATQSEQVSGTYGFMSPEQWAGDAGVDERTDVFAIGVTIVQALTGDLPYGKARITEATSPATFSKAQRKLLPANVDLVLAKAVHPERGRRYQSAAELREDWRRVRRGGLPKEARPPLVRRLGHSGRRVLLPVALGLALALFATLTLMAGGWLVPPAKDKSLRVVHLITEPGGAKAALIPISEEDGRPRVDKAIMPSGLTPVRVADVPPGDYLVVVEVKGHGFHEVFRRVPRFGEPKPTFQETAFPHTAFEVREDQSVELPEVHVPNVGEFAEMPFLPKLTFEMGNAAFGPSVATPYRVTLDAYHLDATEVTVGEFRRVMKGLPAQLRALSPQDDEPVRFVNFDDAVQFAELAGKRLPSEEEYERAATNGGKNRFPWGDDLAAIKSWVIAPVGQPEYDRAVERPLIKGLYSNVAEWTSSRSVPYPGDSSWPGDLIAKLRDTRVVRGGPASAIYGRPLEEESRRQKWDARYRMGVLAMERNIGLGFRCARSAAPRFPGSAAE